jgi:hypothetical protein
MSRPEAVGAAAGISASFTAGKEKLPDSAVDETRAGSLTCSPARAACSSYSDSATRPDLPARLVPVTGFPCSARRGIDDAAGQPRSPNDGAKGAIRVTTTSKLMAGLASAGAAAVMWFPASAGADVCTTECGGGVPGETGLTTALTAVASIDCGVGATCGATVVEAAIFDRLAGNHNETVLTLS